MIVARKQSDVEMTLKLYRYGMTNKDLINHGEPYFMSGSYEGRALLEVFGANCFWKKESKDLLVIGETFDPKNDEELAFVLNSRRQGEIFGRWYSKFCPDGENGFAHYSICQRISHKDFDDYKQVIEKDVLNGV